MDRREFMKTVGIAGGMAGGLSAVTGSLAASTAAAGHHEPGEATSKSRAAMRGLLNFAEEQGFDKDVSKVSIIGVGMITTPGITYRMFQALASKKINILVISTSEIKISVLVSSKNVKKAIAVLHKEFKLD